MNKSVRRGFLPSDEVEFNGEQLTNLKKASKELSYLLNRGYSIKTASTFIGNHYMFSERQRLAIARTVSSDMDIQIRKDKLIVLPELKHLANPLQEVHIDGFNTIITLEVALSQSPILKCMDGTYRDLAGLRGTYRIIDKTEIAIDYIFQWLERNKILKSIIYLDAPVSNSGRLKTMIQQKSRFHNVQIDVMIINEVDTKLEKLPNVITSDAIILNKCISWINMNRDIIGEQIKNSWKINFST